LKKVSFFSPDPPHLLQKLLSTALFLFCDAKKEKAPDLKRFEKKKRVRGREKKFPQNFCSLPRVFAGGCLRQE